jgi:hypothetical protein
MIKLIIAEFLKLKRTLALQMVLIAPLLVLSLAMVIALRNNEPVNGESTPWAALTGTGTALWNLMMVPLVITLQTALTGFTEHSNSMWKYLFTLPYGRWQFFFAKFAVNSLLIGLAQFCFFLFHLLAGYLLLVLQPHRQFSANIPWNELALPAALSFATSLLIVAIHTWVSLRFRSIIISLGTGIGAVVASMIIISSEYGQFFPWTIPGFVAMLSIGRAQIPGIEDSMAYAVSYVFWMLPIALAAATIASLEFSRGDTQ